MLELTYLLTIGVLATTYPALFENKSKNDLLTSLLVEPFELRMQTPHKKGFSHLLLDLGFQLSQKENFCLFPSFFLQTHSGFEAFFDENVISEAS